MVMMKISSFFRGGNVFPTGFFGMKSNNPTFPKWMNFSSLAKVGLVFAMFCVLQNAGLPNSATPPNHFHHQILHYRHRNVTSHPAHHLHLPRVPSPSDLITQTSRHHLSLQEDEPFRLDPLAEGEEDTYDPVEAYHQLRRHYLTSTSRVDRAHYGIGGGGSYNPSPSSGQTRHNHNHHPSNNYHESSSGSSPDRDNNNRNNGYGQIIKGESGGYHQHHHHPLNRQRCYVCLPPNRVSREAKDILAMFGREDPREIADCAEFTPQNANSYEFNCPPGFGGCILRVHGLNVSRACSKYRLNDCKKANSVEFCYCTEPLCNDVKPVPLPLSPRDGDLDDDDEDSRAGGGSGERSVSNKEDEVPSDSELVHDKNRKDSSVALANFNSDGGDLDDTSDAAEDDVRSLKEGGGSDLKNSATRGHANFVLILIPTFLLFFSLWGEDISENLMPFCGRGLHFS